MAVLIPTKKIPQLTAYGVPLAGAEQLEIWATNTSRRITTRDFVLPIDSIITVTPFPVVGSSARQLISSATVQVNDGGAGGLITLDALITGALPGNPTAQVGLATINGVATTWMRSDAAPALSQAIVPAWTGQHSFHRISTGLFYGLRVHSSNPLVGILEEDAAAGNQLWDIGASGEQFIARVRSDDGLTNTTWLAVDRTGTTVDIINLLATTVQVNGQNVRDAAILTSGTVATARLGSGVADATTWLRGDQAWSTLPGSFTGFANPTASVGLAAVNGVATTAMRSDAAPALSQTIAPTWTGQHIFSLAGTAAPAINLSSTSPVLQWDETDAAADNRRWLVYPNGEQLVLSVRNDANTVESVWLSVDRTGTTVDSATFPTQVRYTQPKGAGLTWPIYVTSTAPGIAFDETDAAASNRIWDVIVNGEQLSFRVSDDTASTLSTWMAVARTGTTVDQIVLAGTRVDITNPVAASPIDFFISDANSAVNERLWRFRANGAGQLQFGAANDALSTVNNWLTVDRTGATVDSVSFPLSPVLFNNSGGHGFTVERSANPSFRINESGAAADNRLWDVVALAETLTFRTINDAVSVTATWLSVDRTGTTVDTVALSATTLRFNTTTATTVGAAGGASALPATPTGYLTVNVNGTAQKIPYYAT